MINKLNSFDDLELPEGLFPENCNFYIQAISKRALSHLDEMDLDEINTQLNETHDFFRKNVHAVRSKKFKEAIDISSEILNKRDMSLDSLMAMIGSKALFLQFNDISSLEKYEKLESDISNDTDAMSEINRNKRHHGISGLYFYVLAVQKASRIQKIGGIQNNAFFRLGRVSNYLQFAEKILSIPSGMNRELNALGRREEGFKSVKKAASSKGGKVRIEKYDTIKNKIFRLLDTKYLKLSNRQAAIRICKDLAGDPLLSVITAEFPEETFAKWIGQYRKEKTIK